MGKVFLLARLAAVVSSFVATSEASSAASLQRRASECPGYVASNVHHDGTSMSADLNLAGPACNTYGSDLENLKLSVEYQTCKFQKSILGFANASKRKDCTSRYTTQTSKSIKYPNQSYPDQAAVV